MAQDVTSDRASPCQDDEPADSQTSRTAGCQTIAKVYLTCLLRHTSTAKVHVFSGLKKQQQQTNKPTEKRIPTQDEPEQMEQ